jgi:hypothetical protein
MALPTIRAVGSVVQANTNLTCILPTHATGDLLIVFCGAGRNTSPAGTQTISGWTEVGTVVNDSGTTRSRSTVYALRATSAAVTDPLVSANASGTSCHYAARAISITAGTWKDTGTLTDAWEAVTTVSAPNSSTVNLTAFATLGADRLCLATIVQSDDNATGLTNDGSYSAIGTDLDSSTYSDLYFGQRQKGQATAGSAGATFTLTAGGTADSSTGIVFAVLPAAPIVPVDLVGSAGGFATVIAAGLLAGSLLSGIAAGLGQGTAGRISDVTLSGITSGIAAGQAGIGGMAARADGLGSASGALSQVRPLVGIAAGQAGALAIGGGEVGIGTVTYPTSTTWSVDVTGITGPTSFVISSSDGQVIYLDVIPPVALSGIAAGSAGGAATSPGDTRLVASAAGTGNGLSSQLTIQPPLEALAAGQGQASGYLQQSERGSYTLFTITSAGETLTAGIGAFFVRAADGSSMAVGIAATDYWGPEAPLIGLASGYAGATATGTYGAALVGDADGEGYADASLDVAGLGALADGRGNALALLHISQPLAGVAAGIGGATAIGPQLPTELIGTAAGQGDATAILNRYVLSGTATGIGQTVAFLAQNQALIGSADGRAEATLGIQYTASMRMRLSRSGYKMVLSERIDTQLQRSGYQVRLTRRT